MIKLLNISKSFYGHKVLDDINYEFKEGKVTTIVGPNGSGKSTLMHLLTGFYKPSEGTISLRRGKKYLCINHKKTHVLRSLGVIRTFQEPRMYGNLTVKQALAIGLASNSSGSMFLKGLFPLSMAQSSSTIEDILFDLSLSNKINSKIEALSFGQRKLLDLAGMVLSNANLWLLDEPFAGLDEHNVNKVLEFLSNTHKRMKRTLILIAHEEEAIQRISDYLIELDQGKIVRSGKSSELLPAA